MINMKDYGDGEFRAVIYASDVPHISELTSKNVRIYAESEEEAMEEAKRIERELENNKWGLIMSGAFSNYFSKRL